MMDSQYVQDGEEFEIILAPRRKKAVYSHFEVSSKFVALRRLRDDGGLLRPCSFRRGPGECPDRSFRPPASP